jgi:rod shape-determining protein MreD
MFLHNVTMIGNFTLFKPHFYILFILMLPIGLNRNLTLIISFLTGLVMDLFTSQPGLHTSACLLLGLIRPSLISVFIQSNLKDKNKMVSPSISQMGFPSFLLYCVIAASVYNLYFFIIDVWSFKLKDVGIIFGRAFISLVVSLVLFIISQALFISSGPKRLRNR